VSFLEKLTVETLEINKSIAKLLAHDIVITRELKTRWKEFEKRRDDVERKGKEVLIKY